MSYTQDLRNIIAQIRRVVTGDRILPEDHNLQTDGLEKSADYIDDIYDRIINLIQKGGIFSADLIPNVDLSLNIGSDTKRWNNLFANKGQFSYSLTTPLISVSDETFTNKLAVSRITSDLLPKEELSLNIGSSDLKWNKLYAKKGYFDELYLAGSPITTGKYKYITYGYSYDFGRFYEDGEILCSLSGKYKIGEDTFPVISQILQPYDLLLIHFIFSYVFELSIPSNVDDYIEHSYSGYVEITDNTLSKWFAYCRLGKIYPLHISYRLSGGPWSQETPVLAFVIIPPDMEYLRVYASIESEISHIPPGVEVARHELCIEYTVTLYRLT
jgi:hypothetical protein